MSGKQNDGNVFWGRRDSEVLRAVGSHASAGRGVHYLDRELRAGVAVDSFGYIAGNRASMSSDDAFRETSADKLPGRFGPEGRRQNASRVAGIPLIVAPSNQ
jgi:hypothetical protein